MQTHRTSIQCFIVCHNKWVSLDCIYFSGNFDMYDFVVIYIQFKCLSIDSHNFISFSRIKIEGRLKIQLTAWVAEGISTRGMQEKTVFFLSHSLFLRGLRCSKGITEGGLAILRYQTDSWWLWSVVSYSMWNYGTALLDFKTCWWNGNI